jgi:hypothetical protein
MKRASPPFAPAALPVTLPDGRQFQLWDPSMTERAAPTPATSPFTSSGRRQGRGAIREPGGRERPRAGRRRAAASAREVH